jgi:hypothetical protein
MITTTYKAFGRIFLCQSSTCGNSEKGKDLVPADELKSRWKAAQLSNTMGLTITRCMGLCDVSNNGLIVTKNQTVWLGELKSLHYEALFQWVVECKDKGRLLRLPEVFDMHRFEWIDEAERI